MPSAAVKPASVRKAAQPRALPLFYNRWRRALYRKWRPQRFADVVGQTAITALQNQILPGIGHAYLFTGTRGTGKTTAPEYCKGGQLLWLLKLSHHGEWQNC